MAPSRARHVRRAAPRVRYDRVSALVGAVGVTLVSVLGGAGLLPLAQAAPGGPDEAHATAPPARDEDGTPPAGTTDPTDTADTTAGSDPPVTVDGVKFDRSDRLGRRVARTALAVPGDSGEGRRVVFDQTAQRVWLVSGSGKVERTYLVSGSLEDNLDPGSYEVYSRSQRAWGIDGGTMRYMVRFTHGSKAAIGFHDIPYEDGKPMQTRAELGTAQSSGCIRQWRPDAKALWDFAPVGTDVVVVAT